MRDLDAKIFAKIQLWVFSQLTLLVSYLSFSNPRLTSHFSFRENKVLKKNTVQITGQMMRPSQKIRASASVEAAIVGTYKGNY